MVETEVVSLKALQEKGICCRAPKGQLEEKLRVAVASLTNEVPVAMDYISYAGAAAILRRMKAEDATLGDVGLGMKDKVVHLYLHGCLTPNGFVRDRDMIKTLGKLTVASGLTENQIKAVELRYGSEGRSLDDVAKTMGITKSRVGQLLTVALGHLGFTPRWRLTHG